MRTVNFLYPKTNTFGLAKDVAVMTQLFNAAGGFQIASLDPHEPPRSCDIQVHCEIPIYANIPWASVNIFLVNAEYYDCAAFDPYLDSFDAVIVRDEQTASLFDHKNVITLPFTSLTPPSHIKTAKQPLNGWLYVIGGSARKMAAARTFLPLVRSYDQPVHVYTTRKDYADELRGVCGSVVTIHEERLDDDELAYLQKNYKGHIVLSEAEGFSHAAAEGRAFGAVQFATRLPVFTKYADRSVTVFGGSAAQPQGRHWAVDCTTIRRSDWTTAQVMYAAASTRTRKAAVMKEMAHRTAATEAWVTTIGGWRDLVEQRLVAGVRHLPPILMPELCPKISIVTLTYNRRKFIDLAFHNLAWSDYPIDKIEWVIVDDSTNEESPSDKISSFAARCPKLTLNYVPLNKKTSIAEKRNIGCERASNDIIVFMDDDDHYPQTSLRRRVAWLTSDWAKEHGKRAVGCTMIALYDLTHGTSAVNVPPWALPLGQRVSEASMAFYRSFWQDRGFCNADTVAEGESWINGRETELLEIPPQQILVALSHGGNISSRRVPADAKPACFWGFSPEFLKFLHGLAGMEIEFDDLPKGGDKKAGDKKGGKKDKKTKK